MPLQIEVSREEIADFRRRNRIRKLAIFGPALRDDFTPGSDVDVLVWFEPEARVGLITLGGIARRLSHILGRAVDTHTPDMLSRYFRDRVLAEAETVYA